MPKDIADDITEAAHRAAWGESCRVLYDTLRPKVSEAYEAAFNVVNVTVDVTDPEVAKELNRVASEALIGAVNIIARKAAKAAKAARKTAKAEGAGEDGSPA